MKLKSPRFRSRDYLKHVCALACAACGINPGGVAHHLLKGSGHGMGLKAPDDMALPLCPACHTGLHQDGNELRWLSERGIDGPELAAKLFQRWRDR